MRYTQIGSRWPAVPTTGKIHYAQSSLRRTDVVVFEASGFIKPRVAQETGISARKVQSTDPPSAFLMPAIPLMLDRLKARVPSVSLVGA